MQIKSKSQQNMPILPAERTGRLTDYGILLRSAADSVDRADGLLDKAKKVFIVTVEDHLIGPIPPSKEVNLYGTDNEEYGCGLGAIRRTAECA
jgi:hypothetical protein